MSIKTPGAIAVSGLRKSYDHVVLDGVSLDIPAGSVFALLGPNGAGKTTTVNILTTLIPADAGEIVVAGHDLVREPHAVRAAIGVTGQFSAVDNLLTGEENLLLMADLHHLAPQNRRNRTRDLLEQFGLTDIARKLAATYSGGMRRRLDLAMGLIGDPQVLFLDEPTTGLDPRSRRTVWQIIRELVSGGMTVFLTTQYLDEADHLASQIAVLDRGQIVAEGTPTQLKARIPGSHVRVVLADTTQLSAAAQILAVATVDEDQRTLTVPTSGDLDSLRSVLDRVSAAGLDVASLTVHTADLDDVFLALTGHDAASATQRERSLTMEAAR